MTRCSVKSWSVKYQNPNSIRSIMKDGSVTSRPVKYQFYDDQSSSTINKFRRLISFFGVSFNKLNWRKTWFPTPPLYKPFEIEIKNIGTIISSVFVAQLLVDGQTAHYIFQIPVPLDQGSTCNDSIDCSLADALWQTNLNIWIETTMSHRRNLEAADRTLRNIARSNIPFVGKK